MADHILREDIHNEIVSILDELLSSDFKITLGDKVYEHKKNCKQCPRRDQCRRSLIDILEEG